MKRIFTLLTLCCIVALLAEAAPSTFRWTIPGSVKFYSTINNKVAGNPLNKSDNDTEYTTSATEVFVAPAEDYVITSIKATDGTVPKFSYNEKYGQTCTISYGALDGKTYDVETEKIVRDKSISVKVINGAEYINAKFKEYWTAVPLSKGNNSVAFSDKFEKTLVLQNVTGTSVKKFYEVKRNGTKVADGNSTQFYSYYELKNIQPGEEIEIRVFEEEQEPQVEMCDITISASAGIEDCVKNIFDRTAAKFLTITDNKFQIEKGNDFQVNFNDDITFTSFTYGGKDVTSQYSESGKRLMLKAEGNATLSIAGAATVYKDVEFTVYVMNPEGVHLRLGEPYSLNEADLTGGEPITETFKTPYQSFTNISGITTTIPSTTMTPENTRKFTVKVSEKSPRIFAAPVMGYYIGGIFDSKLENSMDYIDMTSRTVYVVAKPINRVGKATVVVEGDEDVRLVPSPGLAQLWMNPSNTFGIAKGTNHIEFDPEFHTPFTFRIIPAANIDFDVDLYELYLDGLRLSPDENGNFPVNFALPEGYNNGWQVQEPSGEGASAPRAVKTRAGEYTGSSLHAYAIGATAPSCGYQVQRNDGLKLDVLYSDLRRPAPDSFSAEQGTKITLRPDKDAKGYLLMVGNEIVYGFDDIDNVFVNKLTDGEYSFTAPKVGAKKIVMSIDPNASSAVAGIDADNEAAAEIFNLQGISVGNDFDSLPAGIYIRNGKKIVKK